MFELFTEKAREVVVLAQVEARAFDHDYVGTEHFVIGVLAEQEGIAARALDSLEIGLDDVRSRVLEIVGCGSEPSPSSLPFTPRAKRVLELAVREAVAREHRYIGTEHILLGLVREHEGVAAIVLRDLGGDADTVRRAVDGVLPGPGAGPA